MKIPIMLIVLFAAMSFNLECCQGYRILAIFPLPIRSHFMMHEALMKGLARKGHQVDVVSGFPLKKPVPNYTNIINLSMPTLVNNVTYNDVSSWSKMILFDIVNKSGNNLCDFLGHPTMVEIIRNPPKNPPYDLVVIELFVAHCFLGLGYHLKVPTIGVSSADLYPWHHGTIANPSNLAFVASILIDYTIPMGFWQRVHNTLLAAFEILYIQYHTRPQNEKIRKYFGLDAPGVRELETSLALVLVNSHPALNGAKPRITALIEVGGLHVQDDGEVLSEDIMQWMNNSTDGFIYFTFGSMIIIESFPEETILEMYKSLGKIAPIKVLMKITEPRKMPRGMPKNIRTFKWLSQYNVLKHKNIKAFITHGGLMGIQEAIYCRVPMIAIPLFCDQFTNVNICVAKKIAVRLNVDDITEENMDKALNEILYNPVYKNAMLNVSAEFTDRPMSPLDTATWWIEYVIRHGGEALRSPAIDLAWWQIELLDVYVVILLIGSCLILATVTLSRLLVKKCVTTVNTRLSVLKKVD